MAKQKQRISPPHTLSKERQAALKESAVARAASLKNDQDNGNVSRSSDNPDVGRPAKPKEAAAKKGVSEDAS